MVSDSYMYDLHRELRVKHAIKNRERLGLCLELNDYFIDRYLPTTHLSICMPYSKLDDVILDNDIDTYFIELFGCYCFGCPHTNLFIPYSSKKYGCTFSDILVFLSFINFHPFCNHHFLEDINVVSKNNRNIIDLILGS